MNVINYDEAEADLEDSGAETMKFNELALNEIFVAEKDVCKTSCFKLTADEK